MQVLLIFFKKILDKQNDQVSPEFKVKVNNGSCLQQACSCLIVCYTHVESDFILLLYYAIWYAKQVLT